MATMPAIESAWRLRADLTTAKVLIWAASVGRDASLTPETHFYLANRYDRLSHIYRVRLRHAKARRYLRLAAEHYRAGFHNPAMFVARQGGRLAGRAAGHQAVAALVDLPFNQLTK